MRNRIIASTVLVICFGLPSCHTRGIRELSKEDTQRCDQMVARDGELLIEVLAAVNDFTANAPGSEQKLQDVRARSKEHLEGWDHLVAELYAKYGLSEEKYRLDVFRGSFSPRVPSERSALNERSGLRLAAGL